MSVYRTIGPLVWYMQKAGFLTMRLYTDIDILFNYRKKRSIDSLMALKDMKYKDQTSSKERHCELQRQQSTVEVYTRFYIQTPKLTDYFMGSSAFLKVTDLVQSRLRMSDTRIATLTGNIIKGKEDGRTEIQVCHNAVNLGAQNNRFQGYKAFSCSTQVSMKFFLLINVKNIKAF